VLKTRAVRRKLLMIMMMELRIIVIQTPVRNSYVVYKIIKWCSLNCWSWWYFQQRFVAEIYWRTYQTYPSLGLFVYML